MIFKECLVLSFLSHITLFSLFSFSFGNKIPAANYMTVSFMGQWLLASQVRPSSLALPIKDLERGHLESVFKRNSSKMLLRNNRSEASFSFDYHVKPLLVPDRPSANQKAPLLLKTADGKPPTVKKEQTVIFHPLLPYSFPLYFQDRQVAHVELMFKIAPQGVKSPILIKRKISSGNLEVDLLSMRYIGHYLFIQPRGFVPKDWQTVKIDLSAKQE
ncbi:MAG: hypothetical protein AMJ95_09280 [Omnitrophica WOR_2 bacterium SM23_72]|nr:MAG: hypothetical protein AMJ95_09280 [Omnitrophica WOR_2 bacterium SM23_72]